jgi:NAD(P)-dependent dehydrogenase (short-subunit alcohol dehydrogenase family)
MKTVLVTGITSGIGRATAIRLERDGYRVLAGVRSAESAEGFSAGGESEIKPIELDVTDAASVESAVVRAKELTDDDGLVALVNNAGIAVTGPLEVLPPDELRRSLEVNLVGQIVVSQAFLPMLRASRGRIVFVSSIGGRVTFPFAGAYHASKFGLEAAADALRKEIRPSGVDVVLVEPGVTDSRIWAKAVSHAESLVASLPPPQRNLYEEDMAAFRDRLRDVRDDENMSAEKVAASIAEALSARKPPTRVPVGIGARVVYRVRPFVPDRIWDAVTSRAFT